DKHPATRTFQAVRMLVNNELEELDAALSQVPDVLALGGRLAVLSFHSLEDRAVKRCIAGPRASAPRDLPLTEAQMAASRPLARLRKVGGARKPDAEECKRNPRARSVRLRIAEKVC
ncbi:MAG: 16S rRNA (cytosine(1402)-N(4))-methyltransferase, partial [Gammaproteobacteria bacterium]